MELCYLTRPACRLTNSGDDGNYPLVLGEKLQEGLATRLGLQTFGHAYKISKRLRLHFLHGVAAMDLYGDFAQSQL